MVLTDAKSCRSSLGKAQRMGLPGFVLALSLGLALLGTTIAAGVEDKAVRGEPAAGKQATKPRGERTRLSLEQAVQTTLQRNPRVGEALSRIRELQWQSQAIYSDFFPSASINYSGTWPKIQDRRRWFGASGPRVSLQSICRQTKTQPPSDGLPVQDRSV